MQKVLESVKNNLALSTVGYIGLAAIGIVAHLNGLNQAGLVLMALAGVLGGLVRYASTSNLGSSIGTFLVLANGLVGSLLGALVGITTFLLGVGLLLNLISLKGDKQ